MKLFKKTVIKSDFWVSLPDKSISHFYTSAWQRGESPVPLFFLRLLLAMASLGILVWSVVNIPTTLWLVFLTHWGLVLVTLVTLSGLIVSCVAVCRKMPDTGGALPWYVSMYWLMFNIAVSSAFLVTCLYWILLFDINGEQTLDFWLDLATHGFNSVIVMIELVVSRTPVKIFHFYQPLGVGIWYAVFSGIYYAAGGTDGNGNPFIYDVLDWRSPGRTIIVVFGAAVGMIIIYFVVFGISLCRDGLSSLIVRSNSQTLSDAIPTNNTVV